MRHLILVFAIAACSVLPAQARQGPDAGRALAPLWEQIHARPQDFAAACLPLDGEAGPTLVHPDEPFPLASVSKLLIFIEYARQVEAGTLNPYEPVPTETLNRYDLPRTNTGAHQQFLASYPPGTTAITLADVASVGMIQYSSNAASDYVLARLGTVDWDSLYRLLTLSSTSYPHSLSAIPLLMENHDTGQITPAQIASLSVAQGEALFDRYVSDPNWRRAEITYRLDQRRPFPAWDVQATLLQQVTATGTVSDFLKIMVAIYGTGGPLSELVKLHTRAALTWRDNAFIDGMYIEYGSKLGYYSGGTLTLVAYGYPLAGTPVVSVIFFRNIPRSTYNDMRDLDSIGYLAHWMNLNACAGLLEAVEADAS